MQVKIWLKGARVVWTFQNQTEPQKVPHMLTNTCTPHKPPLSHHVPKKPVKQQWSLQDRGTPRKQIHALNALQGCFFWTSSFDILTVQLPHCSFASVFAHWGASSPKQRTFCPRLSWTKSRRSMTQWKPWMTRIQIWRSWAEWLGKKSDNTPKAWGIAWS